MTKLFLAIAAIYLLATLYVYFRQESFIFYPTQLSPNYPFSEFGNVEEVYFQVDEQTLIHALHFHVEQPKGIVLLFHGNSQGLESWGHAAADFTLRGYEVMMPDYRTYGKSKGALSEKAFFDDAKLVYDSLLSKWEESDIILYGASLGTGIATQLATRVKAKLLILETPYLSMLEMVKIKMIPIFPVPLLLKYHFRNDLNIVNIHCPIHILHGTADELIPYSQAERLNELAGSNVLTTIDGGMHNNLGEFDDFQEKIGELLE